MGKIKNFLAWYRLTILRKSLFFNIHTYYHNLTDDSTNQNSQLEFVFKLFDKMVRKRYLTVIELTHLLTYFEIHLHFTCIWKRKKNNLYFFWGTFFITIIYRFFILLLFSEISFIDNSFQFQDNSVSIWQIGQLSYTKVIWIVSR